MNLAIIYGSDSSESEVSVRSGVFTASQLDTRRYNVYEIYARFGKWQLAACRLMGAQRIEFPEGERPCIDKTDFSLVLNGAKVKFDFVYIMQHGTPGENGLMQGYLQMLGIPFSGCNAFVAAITFDKYSCKNYLRDLDCVKCARDRFLRKGQNADPQEWVEALGLPMFIKPTDGGSSFGVTKVKTPEDVMPAIEEAFRDSDTIMAEAAISGRELTCAVYRENGEVKPLPIVEIVPHTEWFDYEAKYNGLSDEICPARINEAQWKMIQEASCRIYEHLGCSGLVRVDYILAEDGLYVLELNTIPGMTSASLVPRMVRTAGIDMTDFLNTVIDSCK